ncbi:hypothetical protein [Salinimicrobium flavum]|uniref:Uncharacterized protein n=1 Tax=Salinimicrobium flavum TaxID=1737065 RepID=A0ABW5IY09_9FLAO
MKNLFLFTKYFLISTGVYILFVFLEIGGSFIQEAGLIGGIQNTWYLIISHLTNLVLFSSFISILFVAKKSSLKNSLFISFLTFLILGPLLFFYTNNIETELGMDSIIIRTENIVGEKYNEEEKKNKRKALGVNEHYQSIEELKVSIDSMDAKISSEIRTLEQLTGKIPDSSIVSNFDSKEINKYKLRSEKKDSIKFSRLEQNTQRLKSQLVQIKYFEKNQRKFELEKYYRFLQLLMLFYLLILGAFVGNKLSNQKFVSILGVGIVIMIITAYFLQMAQSYYVEESNLLVVIFYTLIMIGLFLYFSLFISKPG